MESSLYQYAEKLGLGAGRKLRKQLLRDIYYHVPLAGACMEELNAYYGYDLAPGAYQLMLLRVIPARDPEDQVPLELLLEVEEKMHRDLSPVFRELETVVLEGRILCFFNITTHRDSPDTDQFKLTIGRFFAELSTWSRFGDYAYVMSEGTPAESVETIPDCFQSALQAMEYGAVYGLNQRYDSYEQVQTLGDIMSILTGGRKNQLLKAVETLDRQRLFALIQEIFQDSYGQVVDAPALAYQLPHRILDLTASAVTGFIGANASIDGILNLWHQRIDDCLDLEKLRQFTESGVEALCAEYQKQLSGGRSPAVIQAKAYINSHYREKMYLSQIADAVHLNHQYLSVLFKKETDLSVSDYIAEVRMEHARFLLRNTTDSIGTIAEAVGYPDPQYFSRRFRQIVGRSPQAYRAQNKT